MLTIDGSVRGILGRDEVPLPPTDDQRSRRSQRRADAPLGHRGCEGGVPTKQGNQSLVPDVKNLQRIQGRQQGRKQQWSELRAPWVTASVKGAFPPAREIRQSPGPYTTSMTWPCVEGWVDLFCFQGPTCVMCILELCNIFFWHCTDKPRFSMLEHLKFQLHLIK